MGLFDTYETDAAKEAEGVEVPLEAAKNKDGTIPTFLLAATSRNNVKYSKALETATKPYRRNMDAMGVANADNIYRDVFARTVVKGWKNVQERDGTEIPFSVENAIALFKRVPRVYDELSQYANSVELFQEVQREEEAKN